MVFRGSMMFELDNSKPLGPCDILAVGF